MEIRLTTLIAERFFEKRYALEIAWIRIVVYSGFLYKLLSRDFSVFGFAPEVVLNFYPSDQYMIEHGYSALGFPFLVDLACFHWVHWFFPLPGKEALWAIQCGAMATCGLVLLFGRGPRNVFAILCYALVAYLWGYVWRSGSELDSIFVSQQIALAFCFFRQPEALVLFAKARPFDRTRDNGACFSIVILIFCTYYFSAGINKITDISPLDWFRFDLMQVVGNFHDMAEVGYFYQVAPYVHWLRDWTWLNYIAVPLVYCAELSMPILFFRRKLIGPYWIFFFVFHYVTWGIATCFFGLIWVWWVFLPVYKLFPATFRSNSQPDELSAASNIGVKPVD